MTADLVHLDDTDLLRLLDGACEPAERASLGSHLESCPVCGARRALLERRVSRLSVRLRAADAPPRPATLPMRRILRARRRRVVVRWGLAAAVVLLLASVAGVPPVRAWIAERARALWSFAAGRRAAPVPAQPKAVPPVNDTAGAVTFASPASVFALRIAERQASGTLIIEAGERAQASAAVTGARDSVELLVLPDGLRIVNRRSSTAGYVVRVPGGLSRIVLQIGAEAPIVMVPEARSGRWVADLGARK